ncbi:MAG: glutamate carboxypeptidase, partial [Cytophagales bacterium]|nr:glutamate carboxypeptidase [Cytophagales bacterium]
MQAVAELKQSATAYQQALATALQSGKLNKKNAPELNKMLLALEKSFIDAKGMAYGNWYRSLYASPDPYSGYASWMLPGYQYEASLKSTANLPDLDSRYLAAIRSLNEKVLALEKKLAEK